MKMNLMNELLKITSLLQALNQETFNFRTIKERFSMRDVEAPEAQEVLKSYQEIVDRIIRAVKNYKEKKNGF